MANYGFRYYYFYAVVGSGYRVADGKSFSNKKEAIKNAPKNAAGIIGINKKTLKCTQPLILKAT